MTDLNTLKIDSEATQHFQDGVRDAIKTLHNDLPDRKMTRTALVEMVLQFNQSHMIDAAEMIYELEENGTLPDIRRYRFNMMSAIAGALVGALGELCINNNTLWDDDEAFALQFWNQVEQAIKRLRAAGMAD